MGLLKEVVNFVPKEQTILIPNRRTRRLAYFCVPITPPTAGNFYQKVTDKSDLATYTADTRIEAAFDEGLNEVYLLFEGFDDDSIDIVNENCFTLLASPDADTVSADFTRFDGLIFYQSQNTDILQGTAIGNQLALLYGTGVFYIGTTQDLFTRVLSNGVSQELNPNWNPLTLNQYPNNTPLLTNNITQPSILKGYQISFIASDSNTFLIPSLFWFKAGSLEVMDYYIVEDIIIDVQIATANYLINNKPRYLNSEIGNLTSLGLSIITDYINENKINGGDYFIPSRQEQSSADVINSVVDGAEILLSRAGSIWQIKGTVEQTFQDIEGNIEPQESSVVNFANKVEINVISNQKHLKGLNLFNKIKLMNKKDRDTMFKNHGVNIGSRRAFFKTNNKEVA